MGKFEAGPIAIGAVEGVADALAAFLKLWSGRYADVRPQRRKVMVFIGYALAPASRPLIGLAGNWGTIVVLRSADRLGKGLRGAPRDAILADATADDMQGRAYGLNRGINCAFGLGLTQVVAIDAVRRPIQQSSARTPALRRAEAPTTKCPVATVPRLRRSARTIASR